MIGCSKKAMGIQSKALFVGYKAWNLILFFGHGQSDSKVEEARL